mmetsp:Transcript_47850/g.86299  ORF Transcript_47850/g.86299 Transcript_47850/m.86299 type:complete len:108 (+) Transcript_47850:3244-3567(+)
MMVILDENVLLCSAGRANTDVLPCPISILSETFALVVPTIRLSTATFSEALLCSANNPTPGFGCAENLEAPPKEIAHSIASSILEAPCRILAAMARHVNVTDGVTKL